MGSGLVLTCSITHSAHTISAGGRMALHALLHCHQTAQQQTTLTPFREAHEGPGMLQGLNA